MKKYLLILAIVLLIPQVMAMEQCTNQEQNINYSLNNTINETIEVINESTNCNKEPLNLKELCSNFVTNISNKTEILPPGYCNISLILETDKQNYSEGEKISIYNKLSNKSQEFVIDYWIEDSEGNIIKEKLTTTNTNTKQFTPRLSKNTTLIIKNNLSFLSCININNETKNKLEVFVEVIPNQIPNLTIAKLYLNRTKRIEIGNNLTAQVLVYSGNITNYNITYFIEDVTETKNKEIINQFNYTNLNLTLEIPNNCSINNSTYSFVIKSNEIEDKENFTIFNRCKEQSENITQFNKSIMPIIEEYTANDTNLSESVINLNGGSITGKVVYESSSERAKQLVTYIVMVVLAAVLIGIISSSKNTKRILEKTTEKWSSHLEQQ